MSAGVGDEAGASGKGRKWVSILRDICAAGLADLRLNERALLRDPGLLLAVAEERVGREQNLEGAIHNPTVSSREDGAPWSTRCRRASVADVQRGHPRQYAE